MRDKRILSMMALLLLCAIPALAQDGQIDGTVTRDNGSGVGGVTVVVSELGLVEITNGKGAFEFRSVPAGTYNLNFSLGDNVDSESVEVASGGTASVEKSVDWDVSFAETITVFSASRRRERIVDAPAAVTIVSEEEIQRESNSGQLPKVIEFTPGVEVTQSGIHDYNLNMRGFNSSLNRRVQVIVDGRDPAVPFLGSTEWGYLSNMQNMASVELVRGPSSALYGANAFNGVLNLITKAPRDIDGGSLNLTGGDFSTLRTDIGWASGLGSDWFLKLEGQYTEGESFTRDRTSSVEYVGLPFERVAGDDEYDSLHANIRLDKYIGNNLLTIEGGTYDAFGGVTVTGIGRVNVQDAERNFARINFSTNHFNFLAYHNDRQTPDQIALASGGRIFLDTDNQQVEVQGNGSFNEGKIRVVGGASYRETNIDTANGQGNQTLIFSAVDSDNQAAFGQADFDITDKVKLVVAGRYDDSSLHDAQFSPKAALVVGVAPNHTLRFSYNEAFQVANYSEFFLDAPTVVPGTTLSSIDLRAVEGLCGLLGISCGFSTPTPIRALGNQDLELEEITAFEIGYSGIFGSKAYMTVDYYNNELENFITDLTSNAFGSINPNFGAYTLPDGSPAPALVQGTLAGALGPLIAFLSNNVDGSPIFALASYTNAGAVDTQGLDFGLNVYLTNEWVFDFTYSWFDFDVKELGVLNSPIIPNAPENKFAAGIAYNGSKWGGSLKYRWVDDFEWEAGAFAGPVPSYSVVNLSGNYNINDNVTVGLNVSNLLEDEHWESFGGDILERRALGYVTFDW